MDFFILTANNIKFEQNMTFVELVSQMQPYSSKILCIKEENDEQSLIFFDKTDKLPEGLKLINQTNHIYCFSGGGIHYYVFGSEAAKMFHYEEIKPLKPIMVEYDVTKYKNIVLYDNKEKYKFPYNDKKLIIKTLKIF